MSDANVGCPQCDGRLRPLDAVSADMYECEDCGERVHQVAAKYWDLLESLAEEEDPAMADLAESILTFQGES